MNKYLFVLLLHTSSSLFIPVNNFNLIKKNIYSCSSSNYNSYNPYKPKPLLTLSMTNKNDHNNDNHDNNNNKNRSKIFKINFNNDDLENNDKDVYLILYRIYIYLLIFINWILIVYIIQNT
jgi:hypothetical protein